ncbi:hypothetical protein SDC9_39018 [bioreactor metagenome]|uniref:Uncharacterized protein n=1 Tax=bioreactor metagenome TaxID=1076179 RepID=A0A644VN99_9ZZZZ
MRVATERGRIFLLLTALALPGTARAEGEPLSAIDWLSRSVVTPAAMVPHSLAVPGARPGEPPVSSGVTNESVSVMSLDRPPANALGLVPVARTGLPRALWGDTPEAQLAAALRKERLDTLPSVQAFVMELLLAELDPPRVPAPGGHNVLFLARVDRLLDMGALDQAMALLEQADATDPEVFRRRFDVALLLGEENKACEIMEKTPRLAPSFPARIFCLARSGDWQTAALSFGTGRALGQIDPETADLLERFLEPELADGAEDLPPPSRPSPLVFRMMEAIGQPMSTNSLPVAFAQADLRSNTGWKAQLEAAERLTRMGVLDPNQLLGLYTQDKAAASGGVWDRVTLISDFDTALNENDAGRVARLLPAVWDAMQAQELEPALAAIYGERLAAMDLPEEAGAIAFRLGLLSAGYEKVARAHVPADADEQLLCGIAQGATAAVPAQDQLGLMLKRVFDTPATTVPAPYAEMMPNRQGEALLAAVDDITEGAKGDYRRVESGLDLMRLNGLEEVARRAALEMVILERNG